MFNKVIYSIDVERDIHKKSSEGVTKGLKEFEKLCDRNKILPVLFVTGEILEEHPQVFRRFMKKGWEISAHGYSHSRFDDMSKRKKEDEIKKILAVWRKHLGSRPLGFRAPQHSIDEETLDLLNKHGFVYDSSYAPLNFLQLLFFPKRLRNFRENFFSSISNYKIRPNLYEVPVSAILVPYVSLTVRILPLWLLKFYVRTLNVFYKEIMFYAHSWDFIPLPDSKIDKLFNHKIFILKLSELMKWMKN